MNSFSLHRSFNTNGRFELNTDVFNELRTMKHSQILLTVPLSGVEKELNLKRNFISNGTTRIESNSGRVYSPNENIVHYGGRVEGSDLSFVTISFTEHGIYGIIEDNFVVYGFDNLPDNTYSLLETPPNEEPWTCNHESILEEDLEPSFSPLQVNSPGDTATTKCVYIRWDVDYDVVQRFGSVGAANSYIQALFNAHQQLYSNEGIQIYLNQLVYYDTAPSGFQNTSDVLVNFKNYMNSINFTSSVSDCAHFLYYGVGTGGGSGRAYIPGLCGTSPYAETRMSYWDGNGIPSSVGYNRTVKVVTHELGHNLGCHHTFNCQWNLSWTPGASTFGSERIDASGGPSFNTAQGGSCFIPAIPPGFIGTIMSYCDSTNLCGVSFAVGFGPIPRQRMIDRINSTTCTTICSEPEPTPNPTSLPTPTPTKTPTKTINATPNPTPTNTITKTPTKTINLSPNPTPTQTKTPTVTKTPSVTQTKTPTNTINSNTTPTTTNCCSRFTLTSSPSDTNGSTYSVVGCGGDIQSINVPNGSSIEVNCSSIVTKTSGLGTFIKYPGCVCTTPTPTPTLTLTNTPTKTINISPNPTTTPTKTITPTPTSTPNSSDCEYCISLHPCSINKFFSGCCEPFDTYRIYTIPSEIADTLIDGQSYYVESVGFSGCTIYDSNLNVADYSFEFINITAT